MQVDDDPTCSELEGIKTGRGPPPSRPIAVNIVRCLALRCRWLRGSTIVHVGSHLGQEINAYDRSGATRVIWNEVDTVS